MIRGTSLFLSLVLGFHLSGCGPSSALKAPLDPSRGGPELPRDPAVQPQEEISLFPGQYFCKRNSDGEYSVFRINDGKSIDGHGSASFLSSCTKRVPSATQFYFCQGHRDGFLQIVRLPGLDVMDLGVSSQEGDCLARIPLNTATYFCRRDVEGFHSIVRLADGKVMDDSGTDVTTCLEAIKTIRE